MMHLITGGSGSGKSAYAEEQVINSGPGKRVYIATMIPWGEEGRQRVERHRRLRQEKQFETIECYTALAKAKIPPESTVLLECMSNLVANEMFEPEGAHEATVDAVMEGILHLRQQADKLLIVTNEIFSDGLEYDPDTMRYLSYLGAVNQRLAQEADCVTEVVYGIPLELKRPGRKQNGITPAF
ncbi:MAG: bifunctional adenosylcobinamide kinase/adenosylcobinamide-phosphate guanylyltransferase [Candidatus Choladocola sp.]|nr:bifunctional adenosylcobinamide kinase/adenosylcobinamide-phosphate guanylyltransferase [Candidatus Choladocola sp.]